LQDEYKHNIIYIPFAILIFSAIICLTRIDLLVTLIIFKEGGAYMVINRKEIARLKVEKLKKGYSAFCETKAVADFIDKEIKKLNLKIHIDRTPVGTWYIPIKEEQTNAS
jgi:hypothetical protein